MYSTILVPLEDTPQSRRVLPYVARLAVASHARVVLTQAISDPDVRSHAEQQLRKIAEQLQSEGLHLVETDIRQGEAGRSILAAAEETQTDLIALATDRWTDLDRLLNGSVVDHVLRHASVPLLVVPPDCACSWNEGQNNEILVSLDGSRLAESALQPAAKFASLLRSRVVLLRAVDDARDADAANEYLQEIAHEQPMQTACGVALGDAASAIVHAASANDAALIVMATHGRGGLARVLLGSVATRVLQRASSPLLLVRSIAVAPEAGSSETSSSRTPFLIVG